MSFSDKNVNYQQDLSFLTDLKERRERIMLMLLLFTLPSSNVSLRRELLDYIESLFNPQIEEQNAEKMRLKEKKMKEMMKKEFIVVGNNKDGGVTVQIKDKADEKKTQHGRNIAEHRRKHKIRYKKPEEL